MSLRLRWRWAWDADEVMMLMRLWCWWGKGCGWGKGCWWGNGCWWGKGEERHDRRKVMGEGKQLRESSWWWKGIAEGKKLTRKRSWQWEKANEGKMLKQEWCCSRKEWLLLGWKVNDAGLKSNCCIGKEWMQLMHKVLLPSEHWVAEEMLFGRCRDAAQMTKVRILSEWSNVEH